jgi:hypothetical protein
VQNGQRGGAHGRSAQQPPARKLPLPQLRHQQVLKQKLDRTKPAPGRPPPRA